MIYRRGPTRHTALILWDRDTDGFEVGQWFKGKVYPDRSALAPDGAHLLTFMGTFLPPFRTWTALSRPPFFTALALWPKGDTWGGGGIFVGERTVALDHNALQSALAPGFSVPAGFTQLPPSPATWAKIAAARDPQRWRVSEERDHTDAVRSVLRDAPSGLGLTRSWHAGGRTGSSMGEFCAALRLRTGPVPLDGVGWVDFDRNGDLVFAIGGRLHRCAAAALEGITGTGALVERARLLADFTDLRFRVLRAPYLSGHLKALDDEAPPDAFAPVLDRFTKADRMQRHRARQILRRQAKDLARWRTKATNRD